MNQRSVQIILLCLILLYGVLFIYHSLPGATPKTTGSAADALSDQAGPALNRPAPDFTLPDVRGRAFTLSTERGHSVGLAFFCGCDRCRAAAKAISLLQKSRKLPLVVAIVALPPDAAKDFAQQTGWTGKVLSDPSETVETQYESSYCPRLWAISSAGNVMYRSPLALEGADLQTSLASYQAALLQNESLSDH